MGRIGIDGRGLNEGGTGIHRYTLNLVRKLPVLAPQNEYHIFLNGPLTAPQLPIHRQLVIHPSRYMPHLAWERDYLPEMLAACQIDVFHAPRNAMHYTYPYPGLHCSIIVTIHDLVPYLFPELVSEYYLNRIREYLPPWLAAADRVITISEHSARDLEVLARVPRSKLRVTYLAPDKCFKPMPRKKVRKWLQNRLGFEGRFILSIGGFDPRKNTHRLIQAFGLLPEDLLATVRLVLVGKKNQEYERLAQLVANLGLSRKVIFAGHIPDEEMPYLYSGAELCVCLSLYEGFGLPALEAMAARTAVLVSNRSCFPEVVRDVGFLVDPDNLPGMVERMTRVLRSRRERSRLVKAGARRAADFSWTTTVLATADVYAELLSLRSLRTRIDGRGESPPTPDEQDYGEQDGAESDWAAMPFIF